MSVKIFADLHAIREVLWLRQFQACPSPRADLLGDTNVQGRWAGLKLTECLTPQTSFICMSRENHFHINGFALGLALKRRLVVTRKKARLPADVWENEPAFLPLDTLLWEERSPGARKRSKSTKPTVKCCSYTLFSRYVPAPFKTGDCPDVELQPFDHPNPLPCGRFCNSDSDCGLNNPLKCCASGCGTLCRHPGELF